MVPPLKPMPSVMNSALFNKRGHSHASDGHRKLRGNTAQKPRRTPSLLPLLPSAVGLHNRQQDQGRRQPSHLRGRQNGGILLQPVFGKALHKAFRRLPASLFEGRAYPLQIGGCKGLSYEFAHFTSRCFLAVARHQGRLAALVFSDLAAANYMLWYGRPSSALRPVQIPFLKSRPPSICRLGTFRSSNIMLPASLCSQV